MIKEVTPAIKKPAELDIATMRYITALGAAHAAGLRRRKQIVCAMYVDEFIKKIRVLIKGEQDAAKEKAK